MLTFAHLWLFILAPLPFLAARFLPSRTAEAAAVRVPFLDRIEKAADGVSKVRKHSRHWKSWIVWLLVLTALTRPQWIEPPIEKQVPTRDLLLIVDLSGSMDTEDFTNAVGEKTDRLTATKEVVGDFLLKREGDRVGLVVFGNAAFLQAPFSTDLDLSRQLLEETAVRMAGPRTALGDAIGLGIGLFDNSEAPAKTIIALTDGNDTASQVPPEEAAKVARDRGITIHTIAMGNPESVGEEKLDETTLKKVAATAGGNYFLALDRNELEAIYTELDALETREIKTISHRPRTDLYFWPLAAALLLSCISSVEWTALLRHRRRTDSASPSRLRVNVQTAELEVEEQSMSHKKHEKAQKGDGNGNQ
ncbi:VWA domain-containing protein [Pontiellaceae bacterium B12227]|nr:VWA domain-containing protein [Pontiellaceae bacterium B12227]